MVINGNIWGYYEISIVGMLGIDGSNGCSVGGGNECEEFC